MSWVTAESFGLSCAIVVVLLHLVWGQPSPIATPVLPTDIPEPASCKEVEGNCLQLSFDGENCIYEGPTDLKSGPVTLLLLNESGGKAIVGLSRHTGDETVQDMIDYIGEGPTQKRRPKWSRLLNTISRVPAGETYTWEGSMNAETHTLLCGTNDPHLLWFGTGLTVSD